MSHSFHDQLWKELLAPCYQLKGNIFSRERISTNRAPWQETTGRLKFHFVVTKHLKEAVTGDLNDFFIRSGAEPGRIRVLRGHNFVHTHRAFSEYLFQPHLVNQEGRLPQYQRSENGNVIWQRHVDKGMHYVERCFGGADSWRHSV